MSDEFNVTWEAEDGYVTGGRPQRCTISADDLEDGMDENAIRQLFIDTVQQDFEQTVSWTSNDEDEFVEWAKGRIASPPPRGE